MSNFFKIQLYHFEKKKLRPMSKHPSTLNILSVNLATPNVSYHSMFQIKKDRDIPSKIIDRWVSHRVCNRLTLRRLLLKELNIFYRRAIIAHQSVGRTATMECQMTNWLRQNDSFSCTLQHFQMLKFTNKEWEIK